ncbi:MAG: alpha/beta fold hydrolase [Promethearchaeota archaeon]
MKITLTDGTHIWYDLKGQGPLLVLNHGYGSSHKNFKYIVNTLSEKFTCLLWDQRGHGLSDSPIGETFEDTSKIYSVFQFAEDCFELLEKLNFIDNAEIGKFYMYGVSMGGMVSQIFALNHPDSLKAMILASTTSKTSQPISKTLKSGKIPLSLDGKQLNMELGFTKRFFKTYPEFSSTDISENYLILDNTLILMPENVFGGFNVETKLTSLNIPVMILHGEDDDVMNVKEGIRLGKLIPNSISYLFPNTKHDINKEAPEKIVKKIYEFLCDMI